jgi:energy-coupling factor transport system ATP-binding protein
MDMFYQLHQNKNLSTVLVTHSMEDASLYADQIVIMHQGQVYKKGTPREIFHSPDGLIELGLDVPEVVRFQQRMEEAFHTKLGKTCITLEELTDEIERLYKRGEPK